MSFAADFGPHLPFLRRYARALTGSQASGDKYIKAALSALVSDTGLVDTTLPPRISLFKYFQAIWSSTGAMLDMGSDAEDSHYEHLKKLVPVQRQAFLLTALEGFTVSEVANILGASEDEVDVLVKSALTDIESDLQTKVLIIEDEPIIAADLSILVEDLGHIVTGNATTRDEAVKMATDNPPGLVLCDIQLADNSSGIDAAQDILGAMSVPVIFITAFPERLLTGERPEPTYLIAKPFQENAVKAAVSQALFFHKEKATAA